MHSKVTFDLEEWQHDGITKFATLHTQRCKLGDPKCGKWVCTRIYDHDGPHIALNSYVSGEILGIWYTEL